MRKVLALLLACTLPFCALAETYGVSVSIDTDENLFINYLKTSLMQLPSAASDPQLDTYIRMIQKLLHGLALDMAFQEDAVSVAVQLGGGRLLDAVFHEQADKVLITSSLLEGYALEEQIEPNPAHQEAVQKLQDLDWHQLADDLRISLNGWLDSIEPVVSYGQFVGDAYEGGTQCTTWALEDKDIAALAEAVFSDEVRANVSLILNALGLDADDLLSKLDSLSDRVAKANVYRYLLRIVKDDQETLKGCSLTVYSQTAQLATASLGIQEKELRLVFGFGVQDKNYWCEMTASARGRNNLTLVSGQCLEWMADKEQSFAYVKSAMSPVSNQSWYCNVTKSGQRYLWDASLYEGDKANYAYHFSSAGTVIPATSTLDCSISIGDSPYTPLTLKLKARPVEAISSPDATLERCSMSDTEDAALYQTLVEMISSKLLARLMKLIPLDLLLQLSLPQMP